MTLLTNVLQGDRSDLELIQLVLETLANIMTYEVGNTEGTISMNSLPLLFCLLYVSFYRTSKFTS